MKLNEAVKILRKESKMTQAEFADSLGFSCSTIKRWEAGKTIPDLTAIHRLIDFANNRDVSEQCCKYLKDALSDSRRFTINLPDSALYSVERESICELVDNSHNAIYVCNLKTDEVLYANKKAENFAGKKFETGEKCYHFLHGRSTPCLYCPKTEMLENKSSNYHMVSKDGISYLFRGRKLDWNGQPAHAQCFFEEATALEGQAPYRELINQLDVGICTCWIHDDGHIEMNYMSDGYFAIVGSTREKRIQTAGYGVMNTVCEEDKQRVIDIALAASKAQQPIRMTYQVQLDDGTLKKLYMRAKFIKREVGKSLYYCTVEDFGGEITDTQFGGKNHGDS